MLHVVALILICTNSTLHFPLPWDTYKVKAHWTHQALATYSSYVVAQTFQICLLNFSQFRRCGLFPAPPCSALRFSIVFCVTMASTRVKGKKSHYYLNTMMVLMNSIRFPFYLPSYTKQLHQPPHYYPYPHPHTPNPLSHLSRCAFALTIIMISNLFSRSSLRR